MTLNELLPLYAAHPQVAALAKIIGENSPRFTFCNGLHGSAAAMVFSALTCRRIKGKPYLFVLNDEEEAGYFYHDLTQMLGDKNVLFFPSSYRRAVKYAQRDAANEVLRTQVLNALADRNEEYLFIVTYPEALSERVAPKISFEARTIKIQEGGNYDLPQLERQLLELGFRRVDYVYEPGEFAVRGSILDVFSYSSEYPYRVDFFGDDVETIRTFEVQTQLSKDRLKDVAVVPEMEGGNSDLVPFTDYLPTDALLVVKNWVLITDTIQKVFEEGFAKQAYIEKKDSKERPEWKFMRKKRSHAAPLSRQAQQRSLTRTACLCRDANWAKLSSPYNASRWVTLRPIRQRLNCISKRSCSPSTIRTSRWSGLRSTISTTAIIAYLLRPTVGSRTSV